jgi:Lipopolysaccharide-assembly
MYRRSLLSFLLLALLACGGSSCGYALAGRGSFLPAYIQTIGIPQFVNTTPYYELEQVFTERVRTEFINRGKYKVLPGRVGVDALLNGEILGINITPASFTDQQQASRYVITVTAKIEFRDLKTNKVIWDNPSWVFRDEYEASAAVDALDPNAFFSQDANALERVSTEFAKSAVSAILEAF